MLPFAAVCFQLETGKCNRMRVIRKKGTNKKQNCVWKEYEKEIMKETLVIDQIVLKKCNKM